MQISYLTNLKTKRSNSLIYQNLIFIHIPRTGGTSIEAALGFQLGNDEKHLTAKDLQRRVGEAAWKNAFVFSFVRNPWDRIISLYQQPYFSNINQLSQKPLAYFLHHYQPPDWEKKYYYEYLNTEGVDFIGRFEHRTEDLAHIAETTGIALDPQVHKRKTARQVDYRPYYDEQTKEMVYKMYRLDIEKYRYTF